MGFFDSVRGMTGGRLGIELGRDVVAVQVKGDPAAIQAAGQSAHAGYGGEELGGWLKRWLGTAGIKARAARAVIVDGSVYHYLVAMPEMSDDERHLAAGAEVRRLAPVPASQLNYAHMAVGYVEEEGVSRQQVLISAVDRSDMRSAVATLEAAGLSADLITTVPAALIRAHEILPPVAGGTAIAYLASGRSYLVVLQDGVVELVRDFILREDDRDFDPEAMTEVVVEELRRSFLYFGQRAKGATVDRLVLTGPMDNLADLATRLRGALGIGVEMYDTAGLVDLGDDIDPADQPALAVALGAAELRGSRSANLVSPKEAAEERVARFSSIGRVAAAAVMALLIGWGLWALVNSVILAGQLEQVQQRVDATGRELAQARSTAQARNAHGARRALIGARTRETPLMAAVMQRVGQRVPEAMVLESMSWVPAVGPRGERYWDLRLEGLVLGGSRTESQALFNRFHRMLSSDPLVHAVHLVEPLVIGAESARQGPEYLRGNELTSRQGAPAPGGVGEGFASPLAPIPGGVSVRTTLDDLPPVAPTETSVGFHIEVQLKSVAPGGAR